MFENSLIVFIVIVFYFEKTKNEKTKMTHCFKIRLDINAAQKLRFNCGDTISVFFFINKVSLWATHISTYIVHTCKYIRAGHFNVLLLC